MVSFSTTVKRSDQLILFPLDSPRIQGIFLIAGTTTCNKTPMSKKIELYLHGEGTTDEKVVSIPESATVHDVIAEAKKLGVTGDFEAALFIEDGDDELRHDHRLHDCGVQHKHHVHVHHCRKIAVTADYNGAEKTHSFAPGTRVKRILKWAVDAFGLQGVDAKNKELRLGGTNGTVLTSNQHIGSFAQPPHCGVTVYLTGIVEVQG
jgi:hypothetical protein